MNFGRRTIVLQTRAVSARIPVRPALVTAILLLAALAVGVLALGTGEFTLTPQQVLQALAGEGTRAARLVVVEWRLPRVLLALLIGTAMSDFSCPTSSRAGCWQC